MTLLTRICRHTPLVWKHASFADRGILKVIFFIAAVTVTAYFYQLVFTKTTKEAELVGKWETLTKVPAYVMPGIYQVEFQLTEYSSFSAIVSEEVISTNKWRVGDKVFVHMFTARNHFGPTIHYAITHWDPQTNASVARVRK